MFPPRPSFATRKPARLLAPGQVFGPPPGPADAVGFSPYTDTPFPVATGRGYGDMPYGDEEGPAYVGALGEDPRLVGTVIQLARYNFIAQRSQTWGGTSLITATFDQARKFLEAACNQNLRAQTSAMTGGPQITYFYSPTYTSLMQAAPGGGFGGA